MGAPKQKWTAEEEEALRAGVRKHGPSKWVTILKDPEFSRFLSTRSNIDLKDKWRNISVSSSGIGSREKIKMPKLLSLPSPTMSSLSPVASSQLNDGVPAVADHTDNSEEKKDPPRYNPMIFEALSALKDPSGTDIGAICSFIEQRQTVPPNFRRLLGSKLRRLLSQNKIEKGEKGYKLKSAGRSSMPKPKDPIYHVDPMEGEMRTVAYKIAEAEAKSYFASEAIKEAEKVAKMAEETDTLLILAKEMYQRCARGEIFQMA